MQVYSRPLEELAFNTEHHSRLEDKYNLLIDASGSWQSDNAKRIARKSLRISGIYLWTLRINETLHRIYAGKTNSIGNRIQNYSGKFQPHSPNDYKLQIFRSVADELFPASKFALYFRSCKTELLTEMEREEIKFFKPLLNRRLRPSVEARENLHQAFIAYYKSGFIDALGDVRPGGNLV